MNMMTIKRDEIVKNITLNVEIRVEQIFGFGNWRKFIGVLLIKLASKVLSFNLELKTKTEK